MAKQPKVFISYSYDSPEHRRWVLKLGTQLHHNGVDVILDQWDLIPGQDWLRFIEDSVRDSDRVLVICTDNYVSKADAGEGGVGYEWQIVTNTEKVIPIIREAPAKEKMPRYLEERVYFDFTNENQFDEKFAELLHELRQVSVVPKPSFGKKTFAQLTEIPEQVKSASDAYSTAFEASRTGDMLEWHQLIKPIQRSTFNTLVQWRQNELDGRQLKRKEQFQIVDKAVDIISPLISVALVWGEAGREQFSDQESTLNDLQNIPGWNRDGNEFWVDIPNALGYIHHSLHGSHCLNTNQLDLALSLARAKIPVVGRRKPFPLWESRELMGWSSSFNSDCKKGWQYLAEAYKRWEWLSPIFGTELEYRTSLVAYYMALHIHELASRIASDQQDTFRFNVPLTFVSEGYDINQLAISLLLRDPASLTKLWTSLNVTREQMEHSWGNWIRLSETSLWGIYGSSFDGRIHHQNLFEVL